MIALSVEDYTLLLSQICFVAFAGVIIIIENETSTLLIPAHITDTLFLSTSPV